MVYKVICQKPPKSIGIDAYYQREALEILNSKSEIPNKF